LSQLRADHYAVRQGTAVEEGRLAYRVRTAESGDANALKAAITTTLAHPDQQSRRASYGGAAGRGDILVLERYDRQSHEWHVAGFIECHMRVDDNLSIRDVGTTGDQPQTGVVRYLLDQAFNSFRPTGAQVKIRRDAQTWLDIFSSSPGFYREGEEYRRPHYWTIWRWDRQHADEAQQQARRPAAAQSPQRPRPPQPPAAPTRSPSTANGQPWRRGPRPAERSFNRSRGPRRPQPPRSS
jgi:hypothetical protein